MHKSSKLMKRCLPLCVLFVGSALSSPACNIGDHPVQQEYHERSLQRILAPVTDTAILLARQGASSGSNASMLALAARLMRVHDRFQASCHDHHWEESLTHKLCASFIRWESTLLATCALNHRHQPGSHTTWGTDCICTELQTLIHDCRHHVLPWRGDAELCRHLVNRECEHTHPFGGLCHLGERRAQLKASRRERTRWLSNHKKHGTKSKHADWKAHMNSQDTHNRASSIVERVRSRTKASK